MASKFKLTKDSCEDIGFVKSSLFSDAITKAEFNEWVLFIIKNSSVEDLPLYIFDLIDFNDHLYKLSNIIGFMPFSGLNEEEDNALYGIAIKRFNDVYDMPISKKKALSALEKNAHVLKRFKETFPFIKLDF